MELSGRLVEWRTWASLTTSRRKLAEANGSENQKEGVGRLQAECFVSAERAVLAIRLLVAFAELTSSGKHF